MLQHPVLRRAFGLAVLTASIGVAYAALAPPGSGLLDTVERDYFQPGTQQHESLAVDLQHSSQCASCHAYYDEQTEPYTRWAASLMGQSTRDPIFHAALAIAEQDADFSGNLCLRCHAPTAWIEGRANPTDGSGLDNSLGDFDGVSCHFCHRLTDPVFDSNENPPEDAGILAGLAFPPTEEVHNGQFVVDPEDRRRGPFDLGPQFNWHDWRQSAFHRESLLCATCHDVSNPVFSRQPDGTYVRNDNGPHPTHDKSDEFPIERTFGEWTRSVFALAEIDMGGRFGGNKLEVSTCQDCHMPDTSGVACRPGLSGVQRDDLPQHDFNGANSWVLRAVRNLYPDNETGLSQTSVDDSIDRAVSILQRAADLSGHVDGSDLVVRVVNQSGHKLPTGYGEGRRMWIHVEFFDGGGNSLGERGAYDPVTADLTTADTTVFEIDHALDAAMAAATGLNEGKSFHFVLNNRIDKDNRIPARGFNNAAYENVQAEPVAAVYENEQYWADVPYSIPPGAVSATVELFHQTTTKEYIEFLRDENTTNNTGQVAYDQWDMLGRSAPVLMAQSSVDLTAGDCVDPIPYGLAKLSSAGERPEIAWQGSPSVSSGSFAITLEDAIPDKFAQLFWGDGMRNLPFFGGSLYVTNPVRGPVGRTDAQGAETFNIPLAPALIGTVRTYQMLFRDPLDADRIGLTGGLRVQFCP